MSRKQSIGESEATSYLNLVRILLTDWPNYIIAQAIMNSASPNFDRQEMIALFHIASRGGVGMDLLLSALESDIQKLKTPTLFFREESASSLLVSYWLRTEENTYLSDTLDYQISKLLLIDYQLNQDDKVEELISFTQKFLDSIFKSSPLLSHPTRKLISLVYQCLKRRFPENPKIELQRHIISSIFFVRFICPELSLGKVQEFASSNINGRKNLILIAKLLVTVSAANSLDSHSKHISKLIDSNLEKLDRFCASLMKGTKALGARESTIIQERSEFEGLGFDPSDCSCLASYLERKLEKVKVSITSITEDSGPYISMIDSVTSQITSARTPKISFGKKISKSLGLSLSVSPIQTTYSHSGFSTLTRHERPPENKPNESSPPIVTSKNPYMHLLSPKLSLSNEQQLESDDSVSLSSVRSTPSTLGLPLPENHHHHPHHAVDSRRRGGTTSGTKGESHGKTSKPRSSRHSSKKKLGRSGRDNNNEEDQNRYHHPTQHHQQLHHPQHHHHHNNNDGEVHQIKSKHRGK